MRWNQPNNEGNVVAGVPHKHWAGILGTLPGGVQLPQQVIDAQRAMAELAGTSKRPENVMPTNPPDGGGIIGIPERVRSFWHRLLGKDMLYRGPSQRRPCKGCL
jgi:hypothetical protein